MRGSYDLVIVTGEGQDGVKKWLFGSTSLHLMRKCPCPVWVVKPMQKRPFARILVAVDTNPYESDGEHGELNTKIMELASSMAQREQSELHVVHAWTMFGESLFKSAFAHLDDEQIDERLTDQLTEIVKERFSCHPETTIAFEVIEGTPIVEILRLARQKEIDLILVGKTTEHHQSGLLPEKLARKAPCSVLVVP